MDSRLRGNDTYYAILPAFPYCKLYTVNCKLPPSPISFSFCGRIRVTVSILPFSPTIR
jgi:hypothetical protein